jgi:hypothetical protein
MRDSKTSRSNNTKSSRTMVDLHVVEGEMDRTAEAIREAAATEEASTTIISKRRLKQAEFPVKGCSRLTSSHHKHMAY